MISAECPPVATNLALGVMIVVGDHHGDSHGTHRPRRGPASLHDYSGADTSVSTNLGNNSLLVLRPIAVCLGETTLAKWRNTKHQLEHLGPTTPLSELLLMRCLSWVHLAFTIVHRYSVLRESLSAGGANLKPFWALSTSAVIIGWRRRITKPAYWRSSIVLSWRLIRILLQELAGLASDVEVVGHLRLHPEWRRGLLHDSAARCSSNSRSVSVLRPYYALLRRHHQWCSLPAFSGELNADDVSCSRAFLGGT